jgi:hypothetical protein
MDGVESGLKNVGVRNGNENLRIFREGKHDKIKD